MVANNTKQIIFDVYGNTKFCNDNNNNNDNNHDNGDYNNIYHILSRRRSFCLLKISQYQVTTCGNEFSRYIEWNL